MAWATIRLAGISKNEHEIKNQCASNGQAMRCRISARKSGFRHTSAMTTATGATRPATERTRVACSTGWDWLGSWLRYAARNHQAHGIAVTNTENSPGRLY